MKPSHNACDEEPIRVPGSIQPHGFLLILDAEDARIVAASANVDTFLNRPLSTLLGAPVDTILGHDLLEAIRILIPLDETAASLTYLGVFQVAEAPYSVVTHRVGRERLVEFEPLREKISPELINGVLTNFVSKLQSLHDQTDLCKAIARQVKELTGFNRVLLYSFDEAGHGTVLTEENDGTLPSYLDLRFPATDIPAQARELYILNTVRIIPDATYTPSPLKGLADRPMASLDLSMSLLRSVSPVHLEYMQNMGTMSSMSISIVCDGRLWGLISAHHAEPRTVPYLVRGACDLLTKLVGSRLIALRTIAKLEKMVLFHAVQLQILTHLAAESEYVAAMISQMDRLAQITDASGVALVIDGRCELAGQAPDVSIVLRLVAWLDTQPDLQLFSSNYLGRQLPWAEEIREVASGLIAIRISDVRQGYLLWFRPELVRTIKWAGEPIKLKDEIGGLHPRTSFAAWQELLRGQSLAWTDTELQSAQEFRAALATISLKRAEQAVLLSEARFQQLTMAMPNPVWTSNDVGLLTFANQRWHDQGLGTGGLWFDRGRIVEDDHQRCSELWRIAVSSGIEFEMEARFRRFSDQAERWNLIRSIPFLNADGSRAGWIGTCTDLTDQHERERALQISEKLALTGRMTSVIAHEINNPLESITNLLYLLRQELQDDGPARGYISLAEIELQRISGITKQTLRWSRENAQRAEYGTAGALFDDVLRLLAGKIRNREVTVTTLPGRGVRIFGVTGQLQQVLANLVSNAVDAVPVGGRISLGATHAEAMTEIVVSDEGSGMSTEMQLQIFQPFYSTKGALGNGLGLYISQEIIEKHGGRLVVDSIVGKGTQVRIQLPPTAA